MWGISVSNHISGNHVRKTKEVNLLNPCTMDTIFIKTHQPGANYAKPHFFVLSKGLNSGKPSNEPFTNSFVLVFQTEAQKEDIVPALVAVGVKYLLSFRLKTDLCKYKTNYRLNLKPQLLQTCVGGCHNFLHSNF